VAADGPREGPARDRSRGAATWGGGGDGRRTRTIVSPLSLTRTPGGRDGRAGSLPASYSVWASSDAAP